jgi:hypothetical protein
MNRVVAVLFFIFGFCCTGRGQADSTTIKSDSTYFPLNRGRSGMGPIIGYRGFGNHFLEAGITYAEVAGHGGAGIELSYLSNLKTGDEHLSAYSFGWYSGFLFFEKGINGTVYTDYKKARLYLRPYLGLGIAGIATVGYGYNFSIGKNIFKEQISRHEIRLIVRFPFGLI